MGKQNVSGNPLEPYAKLYGKTNHFNPKQLTYLSSSRPSDSLVRDWLSSLRHKIGIDGLVALGIPSKSARKGIAPRNSSAARLIWVYWSALHCPSNLSSAFHLASWGRFNKDMPKDYREAAERILARKTGPRRARAAGMPYKPFLKPWQGKTPRRNIYAVPPSLPLL